MTFMPSRCKSSIAFGVEALIGSATTINPIAFPSIATKMDHPEFKDHPVFNEKLKILNEKLSVCIQVIEETIDTIVREDELDMALTFTRGCEDSSVHESFFYKFLAKDPEMALYFVLNHNYLRGELLRSDKLIYEQLLDHAPKVAAKFALIREIDFEESISDDGMT